MVTIIRLIIFQILILVLVSCRNENQITIELNQDRTGEFQFGGLTYLVGLQGLNDKNMIILIKPDTIKYKLEIIAKRNFQYLISHTVKLSGIPFRIDSVSGDMSQLFLKKLRVNKEKGFGNRMGDTIFDHSLNSTKGKNKKLSEIQKDKKYIMLDFWGTWCKPCTDLTPKLRDISKRYSEQMSLVGIAFDNDKNKVLEYTKKNKMDWFHTYIDRKERKNSLISELRITAYPTFILLDRNQKIIYRGGPDSLDEIEKILNNIKHS